MTQPEAGSCCSGTRSPTELSSNSVTPISYWIRLIVSVLITTNSLVLALSFNVSEISSLERRWISLALLAMTLVVIGLLGWPLMVNFFRSFRQRRISMESLFVAGIIGATAYSVASMVRGEGALYFEVVSILVVIYSLGSLFKAKARQRATLALRRWSPEKMECHVLLPDGSIERRLVSTIQTGDLVRVFPGQVIPVDGKVVLGQSLIKQLNLTGEPFAVAKSESDHVQAATHCLDGTLTIRATAGGTDRGIDGIINSLRSWSDRESKIEERSRKLVSVFFWAVAAIALTTALVWGLVISDWESGLLNALAVLLVACPCAIGFATPIGLWSGLVRMSGLGFQFNNADSILKIAKIGHVVIDKTGTLTAFEPELKRLTMVDHAFEADEVLELISAIEQVTDHPIARIFHGEERGNRSSCHVIEVEEFHLLPGRGVRATVAVNRVIDSGDVPAEDQIQESSNQPALVQLGSAVAGSTRSASGSPSSRQLENPGQAIDVNQRNSFLNTSNQLEVELISDPQQHNALLHQVNVNVDGRCVAIAEFAEHPMPNLTEMQIGLDGIGVRVSLLSGDIQARVDQLGFANAFGGMSPQNKFDFVKRISKNDQVLFVGDGVNDVSAMSESAVSIAISGGAPLTTQSADGIWKRTTLTDLVDVVKLSRLTASTIYSNLLVAVAYNTIGISLAATGWLHPVAAAVLMLISSLTVTIRSTRILGIESGCTDHDLSTAAP